MWPSTYKPISLPKHNVQIDPHQYNMSYNATIATAGGNDIVLVKSFIIRANVVGWYSMLKPCRGVKAGTWKIRQKG